MSVPINRQKQLIEKYFNLLVKEFITDPRHNKDISIVYKDYLKTSKENSTTLGHTRQLINSYTTWQVINGIKTPGSEKTTTTYKYVITFLNNYENEDQLRETVVHEFTHLYLFSIIGDHDHDKRFYLTMEWLESWLDKNQGLSPRVDKSRDRNQYKDSDNKTITHSKENTCSECFYTSPHHSPQCSQNQTGLHPTNQSKPNITNDSQMAANFDALKSLLGASQDLKTLESAYQTIKTDPLYQEKNYNNNKKMLDKLYRQKREFLQFLNNNQRFSTNIPDSSNKSGLGNREYLLIALMVVGIVLVVGIVYLLVSENQTSAQSKKKR